MTISEQIELAGGWRDAWRTELRGPHGEWVRGTGITGQLTEGVRQNSNPIALSQIAARVDAESRAAKHTDVSQALDRVGDTLHEAKGSWPDDKPDLNQAWKELRLASRLAHSHGDHADADRYDALASAIVAAREGGVYHPNGPPPDKAGQLKLAAKAFVQQAAPEVGKIYGGPEKWNGQVALVSQEDRPDMLGEMSWTGGMTLRDSVAKSMIADRAGTGPVRDPDAFVVTLHELTHGVVSHGTYFQQADAYQDPRTAAIEEGFTQLGTTQHAAEFFSAMGIGDRPTHIMSMDPGTRVKLSLSDRKALREAFTEAHSLEADTPLVLNRLDHASTAAEKGDLDTAISMVDNAFQSASDVEVKVQLRQLQKALHSVADDYGVSTRHDSMAEYARRQATPERIRQGQWGHYAEATAEAQRWVEQIAAAEGQKTAARMTELSDEINREGPRDKIHVMAEQIARASKVRPVPGGTEDEGHDYTHTPGLMTDEDWESVEENILEGWGGGEFGKPDAGVAFGNAKKALAHVMQEREKMLAGRS